MIDGPHGLQAGDMDILLNLLHAVVHVQTAGLVVVLLASDGGHDFIRDGLDEAPRAAADGCAYRAAVGVAQDYHQIAAQMVRCVLHAAQLIVVHDISRYPDGEQLPDARGEDALGLQVQTPYVRVGADPGDDLLPLAQDLDGLDAVPEGDRKSVV